MLPSLDKKGDVLYRRALWQTLMSGSFAETLQAEGHSAKENKSAIMIIKPPRAPTPHGPVYFPCKKDQETSMTQAWNTSLHDFGRVV